MESRSSRSHFSRSVDAKSSVGRRDKAPSSSSNSTSSRSMSSFDGFVAPPMARVKVSLPDEELVARAEQAAARIDFPRLDNPSSVAELKQWRSRRVKKPGKLSNDNFTTFARRSERSKSVSIFARATDSIKISHGKSVADRQVDGRGGDYGDDDERVVAVGEVTCSVRELQHILSTESDVEHNAMSRLLFGKSYIYGSVVHAASSKSEDPFEPEKGDEDSGTVVVKTGAFVHSGLFGANEQWCYLETLTKSPESDAFTVTVASLDERDLVVGKMKAGHVDAISKITAGFHVERIPSSPLVRVTFSGRCPSPLVDSHLSLSRADRRVFKLGREHLKRMSSAVTRLPETVRARRLGYQRLANRAAFSAKNSHCTCCTKSLQLLSLVSKKKRCHLCGFNVCDDCWTIHRIESRQGQLATVRVCRRCLEFIDKGDYSNVGRRSREGSEPRIRPDSPTAEPSGKVLTRLLHDALSTSKTAKERHSIISLIKHLVTEDKQHEVNGHEANGHQPGGATAHRLTEDGMDLGSNPSSLDDNQCDAMLEALEDEPSLSIDSCTLANNDSRAYPLRLPDSAELPSEAPIPDSEAQRLSAIERYRLMSLTDTDELDIICTLIAREMKCSTGLVTLIDDKSQKVLASNVEPLRQLEMPRNHSFCQHTIMGRAPLLAPHPEADIRFQNLPPLHQMGMRFYFGFPLFGADNAVVGSVCCLDAQSHEVTQAQYSAMQRLATTASKIVQVKGRAMSGDSPPQSSSLPIPAL